MINRENRHIIKKQVVELEVKGEKKARNAQERLQRIFKDRLLPIISQAFDELSPPNILHQIERLEIDLGEVQLNNLEQDIERQFKASFQKILARALNNSTAYSPPTRPADFLTPGAAASLDPNRKEPTEVFSTSSNSLIQRSSHSLFLFFLETGTLPWWAETNPDLLEEMIAKWTSLPREVFTAYFEKEECRKRAIVNLKDLSLTKLISLLSPVGKLSDRLKKRKPSIPILAKALNITHTQMRYYFWEAAFFSSLFEERSGASFATHLLIQIAERERRTVAEIMTILQERQSSSLNWLYLPEHGTKTEEPHLPEERKIPDFSTKEDPFDLLEEKKNIDFTKKKEDTANQQQRQENTSLDNMNEEPSLSVRSAQRRFNQSDEIYINNAGLVVIWLFLPGFFEHLGWVAEKAFRNIAVQHRAVWMLQYLGDGSTESPEFLLPLNKMLCGVPLAEPLEPQAPLSEEEQNAGQELLAAVLEHATGLGNISVEGFRQTFLNREGVLSRRDNYWLLRVKKETFDIVLTRLNWSYQMVKLPWMQTAIYVEW